MVLSSPKCKPDIPYVLTENLGGYLVMAQQFVQYLDFVDEQPKDARLVHIAKAISDLRVEPGYAKEYEAFMFRVSAQWSHYRIAEHLMTSEPSVRRRIARARAWILARIADTAAA